MAQVKMQQVKELRERTQAGLNDCRTALMDADGDMDKAVELILKKGLAKSAKRAGAAATEGVVLAKVASDAKSAVMVEVNIQTDFAARNQDFLDFADKVLEAATQAPEGAELGTQPFPGGSGTIEENRQALVGKLGENVTVRRWDKLSVEGPGLVHAYVHMGGKVGALLAIQCEALGNESVKKLADDVAMQVAAMAPHFLRREDAPEAELAKQREIFDAQLIEEGKPENVRPKIVEGKVGKWLKEVCLLQQQSVMDSDKTIDQVRATTEKEVGAKVDLSAFVRYERGEGIEKPTGEDFATEVAKMAQG